FRVENKKLKDLLERVLVEVREYRPPAMGFKLILEIARLFNPSSRPWREARSREDPE
ncbi:hypothetical protein LCGC14_3133300, partial [marine sediment metagenome]